MVHVKFNRFQVIIGMNAIAAPMGTTSTSTSYGTASRSVMKPIIVQGRSRGGRIEGDKGSPWKCFWGSRRPSWQL